MLFVSRQAQIVRFNNGSSSTRPEFPNAFTVLEDNTQDPNQQGSIVHVTSTAEECPFDSSKSGTGHYSTTEFLEVIGYATAHELFHILCGPQHNTNQGTVFGLGYYLSIIITPADELSQINLKQRSGVTQ